MDHRSGRQTALFTRHNKPFNGYEDQWETIFGTIELDEDKSAAAIRETREEFGIYEYSEIKDLTYTTEYAGKHGPTIVHWFALQVPSIDARIVLNEESIGYDWATIERARVLMKREDEFKALETIIETS